MKLKSVVLASAAAVLGLGMGSAFAGLTLCSHNYANQIDVSCSGTLTTKGAPMPASPNNGTSCASILGTTNLPWKGIYMMFGAPTGKLPYYVCTFTDDVTHEQLATAKLQLNNALLSTQGKVFEQGITGGHNLTLSGANLGQMTGDVSATVVQN